MAFFAAQRTPAQVAELVDALGSGPSGGNTVEVRVLSWAPDSKVKPPDVSHRRLYFLCEAMWSDSGFSIGSGG